MFCYARLMGIEFGFLDDKSAGFQLEDTELLRASRVNRLLTILALCSLGLLSIGTYVVSTNLNTDVVDQYSVRVDVTEEFPFLVTKLSPYFDR